MSHRGFIGAANGKATLRLPGQTGRSRRHRSSEGLFRPASSLFLAPGPFGRNADATGELKML